MITSNFAWTIDRCERIINNTPKLLSLLHNSDFILDKMNQIKVVFSGRNAPLGMVFSQLYSILFCDEPLRKIVRSECEQNFEDDQIFPFFIFWCTVIVYTKHIEIYGKQETRGEE